MNLFFLVILLTINAVVTFISILTGIDLFAYVVSGQYLLDLQIPTLECLYKIGSEICTDPFGLFQLVEHWFVQYYKLVVNKIYSFYFPGYEVLTDKVFDYPVEKLRDEYGHRRELTEEERQYFSKEKTADRAVNNAKWDRLIGTVLVFHVICCMCVGLSKV